MKIKKISIENYRFFKENQPFDFESKNKSQNILIYGENGSGKTSLYNALLDFFFYYKDEVDSKEKLKENKNIFANTTDEPKIEITFDDNTTINFTKNGLDKDSLKAKIERVSKSKLFLTYQDIYSLNNIFKKELTYKEFKDVFTILYFDDLKDYFTQFESIKKKFETKLEGTSNEEFLSDYNSIKEAIENFDFELLDNELLSEINNGVVEVAYYLPQDKLISMKKSFKNVKLFIEFCDILKINIKKDYLIKEKLDKITDNVSALLEENDRFEIDGIDVVTREDIDGLTTLDELLSTIDSFSNIIDDYLEIRHLQGLINDIIYENLESKLDNINEILDFLEVNIKIDKIIEKDSLHYDISKLKIFPVKFKIELSGIELKNHWSNLNEAKLSALNFAIYLSSVLGKKPDIPILVLDDLLISLDMSNRDKMINLLLDRSEDEHGKKKYFDDEYQMMIFTHDKAFFEMAKYKFDNINDSNWKYLEMYEDSSGEFPKPLLMPSECHFEKAKTYFKLCDYPTAGNYLRKASELIIKDKLLDTYFKEIERPTLAPMIEMYKKMYADFNLVIPPCILTLEELTKRIFNPSSHDDLVSPLYKKEIDDAIKLVSDIRELPKIEVNEVSIKKGSLLTFKYNEKYEAVYRFLGDVKLYDYSEEILIRESISIVKCSHKILKDGTWEEKYTTDTNLFNLQTIFNRINHFLNHKFQDTLDKENFISYLTLDGEPLTDNIKKLFNRQCNEGNGS